MINIFIIFNATSFCLIQLLRMPLKMTKQREMIKLRMHWYGIQISGIKVSRDMGYM